VEGGYAPIGSNSLTGKGSGVNRRRTRTLRHTLGGHHIGLRKKAWGLRRRRALKKSPLNGVSVEIRGRLMGIGRSRWDLPQEVDGRMRTLLGIEIWGVNVGNNKLH